MSFAISEVENHLTGMGHGSTLKKVRNRYYAYQRAANNMLHNIRPLETMRTAPLASTVYDQLYNYAVPSDFDALVGIYPQVRTFRDDVQRTYADRFDRRKTIDDKKISIEGDNAAKLFRIDYHVRTPKVLNTMDTYDGNGTWSAVGTASGVATDTIFKYSGGGSVKFDSAASGDGIQNTGMTQLDLSDEDEIGDVIIPFYIKNSTDLGNLTSVTVIWGNDVSTQFWTGVAQTAQADGTAFKVGWNVIKVPWSTATETGTVAPATIDSAKITFATSAAISDIRVDNILFSIGYPFDVKYYSKFLFQNSSGTWINQPTTDTDVVVCDNDTLNIFLYEVLDAMAQQMEGEDSASDATYAAKKLWGDPQALDSAGRIGLYAKYRSEHPDQSKKAVTNYGMMPRFGRYSKR